MGRLLDTVLKPMCKNCKTRTPLEVLLKSRVVTWAGYSVCPQCAYSVKLPERGRWLPIPEDEEWADF